MGNNLTSDYEYLYEFMVGSIDENNANAEKFARLRERGFITADNKVNLMVVKGLSDDFFAAIPTLDEELMRTFAGYALESAEIAARDYPLHMRDLVISQNAEWFTGNAIALMVKDILYGNGTFKPLTETKGNLRPADVL